MFPYIFISIHKVVEVPVFLFQLTFPQTSSIFVINLDPSNSPQYASWLHSWISFNVDFMLSPGLEMNDSFQA
jgi:hypothetical protein